LDNLFKLSIRKEDLAYLQNSGRLLNTKYSGKLILTYLDPYIVAYPTEEWVGIEGRLKQLPTIQKDIMDFYALYTQMHQNVP